MGETNKKRLGKFINFYQNFYHSHLINLGDIIKIRIFERRFIK